MSFESIEEARAKCTVEEAIKDKGKRGRKRKSAELEAEPEPEEEAQLEPEVARATKEIKGKRGRKRKNAISELEPGVARMIEAPEPWRAQVVQMI